MQESPRQETEIIIDLGAASALTLGEDWPDMNEGVDLEDRYF
jgi:hypothetical protein